MARAMLIDVSNCIGCRGCQIACKRWNGMPAEKTRQRGTHQNPPRLSANTWKLLTFNEATERGTVKWLFLSVQCQHCTQASCVSVCPSGAAQHQGDFVVIDQEQCIGCGYCTMACPFGVPHLSNINGEAKSTARKCTFCIDRVANGLLPACAQTCPVGAYHFGDREKMIALGQARVEILRSNGHPNARLYGKNELGGLHVMYVLTERASLFGLPERPQYATLHLLGHWASGLVTAGVVCALPFWMLFKRKEEVAAGKGSAGGARP